MDRIDLRSDTVTWPTDEMRHAMANAPLGDDVFGDDPTVHKLEALAAQKFGKEAALFTPSGTMSNIISIMTHCNRGDEAIMGNPSHTFTHEGGNPATLAGVHSWPIPVQPDGTIPLDQLEAAIRVDDPHFPKTGLVCIENTQSAVGGQPLPTDYIDSVGEFCHTNNLKLHIDGARIFNAAVALNEDVARLTQAADSVSFCLSKGLCAPIGSLLVGNKKFIYRAHRFRKTLGGGMRQAGLIAAAGIVALETMTERLSEDHQNACRLAEGLATIPCIDVDIERVKTNIIYVRLNSDAPLSNIELHDALAKDNIGVDLKPNNRIRFATHYWIKEHHVDFVLDRLRSLLA